MSCTTMSILAGYKKLAIGSHHVWETSLNHLMQTDNKHNFRFPNFIAPKRVASTLSTHGTVNELSQSQLYYGVSKSFKQDQFTKQIK